MENKEDDPSAQPPRETNQVKHVNYFADDDNDKTDDHDYENDVDDEGSEGGNRRGHDADSGHDWPSEEMLQDEKRIDPGNEHHHRTDADAGSDTTGTTDPEPGEGKNDAPDTSGEDG